MSIIDHTALTVGGWSAPTMTVEDFEERRAAKVEPDAMSIDLSDPVLGDYLATRPVRWIDEDGDAQLWLLAHTAYDFTAIGIIDEHCDPDLVQGLRVMVTATDTGPLWLVYLPGDPTHSIAFADRHSLQQALPQLEQSLPVVLPAALIGTPVRG